jgi:hypothetical protein
MKYKVAFQTHRRRGAIERGKTLNETAAGENFEEEFVRVMYFSG